ncbi:MAG: HEPN domain-containing protein [Candidatus Margulisiibacteriota bacterium]
MSYKSLENKNLISPFKAPLEQIEKEMKLARRDLKVAQKNLKEDYDWAFAIAYNAVLQAGRALMLSKGYRPRGEHQHKTVLKFIELSLGKDFEQKARFLDMMRSKRHRVIYDEPELISESEAKFAIQIADEFVKLVRRKLGL